MVQLCRRVYLVTLFVFLALACSGSAADAQSTFATISGTIQDTSGAVLPGVAVTAHNEQTGLVRSVVTGERGAYRITELPPGRYSLKVELTGFAPQERAGLTLALGAEMTLPFNMELSTVQEAVTTRELAPELFEQVKAGALAADVAARRARRAHRDANPIPTPLLPLRLRYGRELVQQLLLDGQRVLPTKLTDADFAFGHTELEPALRALLGKE